MKKSLILSVILSILLIGTLFYNFFLRSQVQYWQESCDIYHELLVDFGDSLGTEIDIIKMQLDSVTRELNQCQESK